MLYLNSYNQIIDMETKDNNDKEKAIVDGKLNDATPVKECIELKFTTTATVTFELVITNNNCCEECAVQRYCEQRIEKHIVCNPESDLDKLIFNCIYSQHSFDYTIKVKKD